MYAELAGPDTGLVEEDLILRSGPEPAKVSFHPFPFRPPRRGPH